MLIWDGAELWDPSPNTAEGVVNFDSAVSALAFFKSPFLFLKF